MNIDKHLAAFKNFAYGFSECDGQGITVDDWSCCGEPLGPRHGCKIHHGRTDTLADPFVFDWPTSFERDPLLVDFVVIERLVVCDDNQERNVKV
ncbi:hypothetical protein QMO17_33640, partial [Klebsiella pneumoniae]|nr:hypothetical protein [Klebsiella pneumoniae]